MGHEDLLLPLSVDIFIDKAHRLRIQFGSQIAPKVADQINVRAHDESVERRQRAGLIGSLELLKQVGSRPVGSACSLYQPTIHISGVLQKDVILIFVFSVASCGLQIGAECAADVKRCRSFTIRFRCSGDSSVGLWRRSRICWRSSYSRQPNRDIEIGLNCL